MPCAECSALLGRVEAMERFCRKVAGAFDISATISPAPVAAAPRGAWPAGWPEPPEDVGGQSRASAWRAGFRARLGRMPVTACPYASNSRGHDSAWIAGHEAAKAFGRT